EEVQSGRFPSEAAVLEEALVLLRQREHGQARQNAVNGTHPRPIGEVIDELMGDVPRRSWTGSRLMEPPGTATTSTVFPRAPPGPGLCRHGRPGRSDQSPRSVAWGLSGRQYLEAPDD